MYGKGVNAYRQTHVVTADPQKLIVMCYEGVIKNLRCARTAYELNDYETKGQSLTKAHDIVVFLIQSLDMEKGGRYCARTGCALQLHSPPHHGGRSEEGHDGLR